MIRRMLLAGLLVSLPAAWAQAIVGRWDATIVVNKVEIPFRMEFAGLAGDLKGWFFNGDEKVMSSAGRVEKTSVSPSFEGSVSLSFDYYNAKLEATVKDGAMEGTYTRNGRAYPFRAHPAAPVTAKAEGVPSIGGLWEIPTKSSKGEAAWRLIIKQKGADLSAAILRVDGDTGALTGTWRDGKFVLSHFSAARPMLLEITPQPDGTLALVSNGQEKMNAIRPAEARAKGLPEPTDPAHHTSVKDPAEKFHFAAPDLSGRMVTDNDDRFHNKVLVVAIGGSWCPNCHDEAPFLEELYRKYRARGLEIVALSFEEADQLKDPARLRAFIKKYGIDYTVLLAGETGELHDKVPQAVNLNSWPTTFFLGRDGKVREVHAGFAARASGEFHDKLREETYALVERLVAEPVL
jgi:thiol-disulfide isomerase/thioredoxin